MIEAPALYSQISWPFGGVDRQHLARVGADVERLADDQRRGLEVRVQVALPVDLAGLRVERDQGAADLGDEDAAAGVGRAGDVDRRPVQPFADDPRQRIFLSLSRTAYTLPYLLTR